MAIMDKIFFWRHKEPDFPTEDTDLGKEPLGLEKDVSMPGEEPIGAGLAPPEPMPGMQPEPAAPSGPAINAPPGMGMTPPGPSEPMVGKDIEIISAKIDALKATLDSINQRLENLERIAKDSNEKVY